MNISSKNRDKLISIFDNYHEQNDKILSCLDCEVDEMVPVLLTIINNMVKEEMIYDNKNAVYNMLELIEKELSKNRKIDIDKCIYISKKIIESISSFLLEESFQKHTRKEYRTFFYHFSRRIMKLPFTKYENNEGLKVVLTVIKKIKKLEFIEMSLGIFDISNSTLDNNNSLIMEVIDLYIDSVQKLENKLDDSKYYYAVIKLLLENEHIQISQKEKEICIDKLSDAKTQFIDDEELNNKKKCFLNDIIDKLQYSYDYASEIDSLSLLYDVPVEEVDNILVPEIIIDKYSIDNRNRVLTKDYIISIDGENTSEIDDALSCERLENGNYLLGIHIADVFGVISINDSVIYEAMNRATAIHLPGILIPMFPNQLAKNDLSLLENKARYADSHYFEITPDGEIVWDRMMESITYNDKKVTYDFVNKRLEKINNEESSCKSPFDKTIYTLQKVANILEKKVFSSVDCSSLKINTDAGKIVLYTMLLENISQANYASTNNYPLIYRTQTISNKEIVKEAADMLQNIDTDDIIKLCSQFEKSGNPAVYSNNGRHEGLRIEHYCHFTSPIRRFADLWNRYLNKKYRFAKIKDKELQELFKKTDVVIDNINHQMKNVEYFTNDYNKYLVKK